MGNPHVSLRISLLAAIFVLGNSTGIQAGGVFTFSDATHSARATFAQDGTTLSVTLENLSTFDILSSDDVLTGIFFDLAGVDDGTLTPLRALLGDASSVWSPKKGDGTDKNDEIGGEYAFRDDLTGAFSDTSMVIGAVDMGQLLLKSDRFPGKNLFGRKGGELDGIEYGLISAFDDPLTGDASVTGNTPFVSNSVVFELAGLSLDFVLDGAISNVRFNYGSNFNPVPEPSTLVLLAVGAVATFARRRRRI